MKRKNILSLVALILVLLLTFAACGGEEIPEAGLQQQVAALQQENAQLKSEIEVLTKQLESFQTAVLKDWSLTAVPLADNSGATIAFTGVPATAEEGLTATLVVQLNGYVAESMECTLEGDSFTASLILPAMDGYSYFCMLDQQMIPLVGPDLGGDQSLVNLGSALNAYCSLFVDMDQWSSDGSKLTIGSAFATAQMPTLTLDGTAVTVSEASLVLLYDGAELERKTVTMAEGEGEGTYEAAITDCTFSTPHMEDDHQYDLVLEVNLSNGTQVSFNGCSFPVSEGKLSPISG